MKTKTPNDYLQIKFRPGQGSKLERTLITRSGGDQSNGALTETIKSDLTDHYTLLDLCLPGLNRAERDVIQQALHGWLATPENVHTLWVEVEALSEVYECSGVDISALAARLQSLSRFECWCIVNAFKYRLWDRKREEA